MKSNKLFEWIFITILIGALWFSYKTGDKYRGQITTHQHTIERLKGKLNTEMPVMLDNTKNGVPRWLYNEFIKMDVIYLTESGINYVSFIDGQEMALIQLEDYLKLECMMNGNSYIEWNEEKQFFNVLTWGEQYGTD
jgi:hypothetical protein